jgi:adenosine deaminase
VQQVEALERLRPERVVGIHLGGDEAGFPGRDFVTAFELASEIELGRAVHAGEGDGARSVRDAVEVLGASRIGHGIRCLEDEAVVELLRQRQVTLEVCLSSNVATGVVRRIEEHPLPQLLQAGLQVTLGSDDPSYFHTDVEREMRLAHDSLGLSVKALDACVDTGIRSAFLPQAQKQALQQEIDSRRRALR